MTYLQEIYDQLAKARPQAQDLNPVDPYCDIPSNEFFGKNRSVLHHEYKFLSSILSGQPSTNTPFLPYERIGSMFATRLTVRHVGDLLTLSPLSRKGWENLTEWNGKSEELDDGCVWMAKRFKDDRNVQWVVYLAASHTLIETSEPGRYIPMPGELLEQAYAGSLPRLAFLRHIEIWAFSEDRLDFKSTTWDPLAGDPPPYWQKRIEDELRSVTVRSHNPDPAAFARHLCDKEASASEYLEKIPQSTACRHALLTFAARAVFGNANERGTCREWMEKKWLGTEAFRTAMTLAATCHPAAALGFLHVLFSQPHLKQAHIRDCHLQLADWAAVAKAASALKLDWLAEYARALYRGYHLPCETISGLPLGATLHFLGGYGEESLRNARAGSDIIDTLSGAIRLGGTAFDWRTLHPESSPRKGSGKKVRMFRPHGPDTEVEISINFVETGEADSTHLALAHMLPVIDSDLDNADWVKQASIRILKAYPWENGSAADAEILVEASSHDHSKNRHIPVHATLPFWIYQRFVTARDTPMPVDWALFALGRFTVRPRGTEEVFLQPAGRPTPSQTHVAGTIKGIRTASVALHGKVLQLDITCGPHSPLEVMRLYVDASLLDHLDELRIGAVVEGPAWLYADTRQNFPLGHISQEFELADTADRQSAPAPLVSWEDINYLQNKWALFIDVDELAEKRLSASEGVTFVRHVAHNPDGLGFIVERHGILEYYQEPRRVDISANEFSQEPSASRKGLDMKGLVVELRHRDKGAQIFYRGFPPLDESRGEFPGAPLF